MRKTNAKHRDEAAGELCWYLEVNEERQGLPWISAQKEFATKSDALGGVSAIARRYPATTYSIALMQSLHCGEERVLVQTGPPGSVPYWARKKKWIVQATADGMFSPAIAAEEIVDTKDEALGVAKRFAHSYPAATHSIVIREGENGAATFYQKGPPDSFFTTNRAAARRKNSSAAQVAHALRAITRDTGRHPRAGDLRWAYHVTLSQFLPSIREKGLLPAVQRRADNEPVIFVEPDEEGAAIYATADTSMLRFLVDGIGDTEDGESVLYETSVSPDRIEIRTSRGFVPLLGSRKANPSSAAQRRWLVFSNGLERSKFWPWGDKLKVDLPGFEWPAEWDYCGTAREIRYDSDKMLPDKHDNKVVPYMHDFESHDVRVFAPRGECSYAEPVEGIEARRSVAKQGKSLLPSDLAFLAKCEGWSVCPPNASAKCNAGTAVEAFCVDCILMASPEGDLLVVLDGEQGYKPIAVFVGPTLVVERDGIDDG